MKKIYTRTGDQGETGLPTGPRVSKDAPRLEACGSIDELNAVLGLVRAEPLSAQFDRLLARFQNELFELGAELAAPGPLGQPAHRIGPPHIQAIEELIDHYQQQLPPLEEFILPCGTRAGAGLQVARAVCRRAERRVVTAARETPQQIAPTLIAYLNRLGDLLFVLARALNAEAGQAEVPWKKAEGNAS